MNPELDIPGWTRTVWGGEVITWQRGDLIVTRGEHGFELSHRGRGSAFAGVRFSLAELVDLTAALNILVDRAEQL